MDIVTFKMTPFTIEVDIAKHTAWCYLDDYNWCQLRVLKNKDYMLDPYEVDIVVTPLFLHFLRNDENILQMITQAIYTILIGEDQDRILFKIRNLNIFYDKEFLC
jgi:hypothetical protein